jgi:MFS family permease
MVLQIGVALVQNIGGFLALRLLSGIACSPPATLGAGTITDVYALYQNPHSDLQVWNPGLEQVIGVAVFLISPFVGPVLGPIVGGYVIETVGWRWTIWILMIFSFCVWILQWFAPETYSPYILYRKAKRLQKAGEHVVPPKTRPFRLILATALKRPPRTFPSIFSRLTGRHVVYGALCLLYLIVRRFPLRLAFLLLPRLPSRIYTNIRIFSWLPRTRVHRNRTWYYHR